MTTLVSLVGLQPEAVAVTIKTWMKHHPDPCDILLLVTPQTRKFGERIKTLFHLSNCTLQDISDDLQSKSHLLPPYEVVQFHLQQNASIVFCADPGFNFQVASIAKVLPKDTTFLHADTECLHACQMVSGKEVWKKWYLENLGLDVLFALHDLKPNIAQKNSLHLRLRELLKPLNISLPADIHVGLSFPNIKVKFPLHLAFEFRGRLYGLIVLRDSKSGKLQQTRDIEQYQTVSPKPFLAVVSADSMTMRHIKAANHVAINIATQNGQIQLKKWIQKSVPKPGRQNVVDQNLKPTRFDPCQGKGGDGKPLAVCFGEDPSATLISLCTHRPQKAWIMYDGYKPSILEKIDRFRKYCKDLPVGEIGFLPTNHLGWGIRDHFSSLAKQDLPILLDITPGTKAQGAALANVGRGEIWSIRGDLGIAVSLDDPTQTVPLAATDLLTQACIVGGELVEYNKTGLDLIRSNTNLMKLLLCALSDYVNQQKDKSKVQLSDLPNLVWKKNSISVHNRNEFQGEVKIVFKGQTASGMLPFRGGYWFELVTAYAFSATGVDEILTGLIWRLETAIETKTSIVQGNVDGIEGIQNRAEVDVLGRMNHRFFAVSCKVGSQSTVNKACQEVEAVAKNLGRFTLPILVKPYVDPDTVQSTISARSGVVQLGLKELTDPNQLKNLLEKAFQSKTSKSIS